MTGSDLTRAFLKALCPPPDVSVSQWAEENRILVSESSAAPGKWRTEPYQREVMDAFTDNHVEKIIMMFGSQIGKTEMMLNMMFRAIDIDPGPIAYVNATALFSEDFSKRRFEPAARVCESLAGKLTGNRSRKGGDASSTVTMKTFSGGSAAFIGAGSPVDLAGRPIRYVFGDEIDRWPRSAGSEGDPMKLVERRTATFLNRKLVFVSTPTIKGESRIEAEYLLGTQEQWKVKCPGCGKMQYIAWDDIRYNHLAKKVHGKITYYIKNVRWKCPDCGEEYTERRIKDAPAQWIARNPDALQERRTRSFQMNALMSPWARWTDIIREYLEAGNDANLLQVFFNTQMGESWAQAETNELPNKLHERREEYAADVPDEALVLTMGIDTQDNRLEYEIVGWGEGEESWGVRYGVIPGRADTANVWQELEKAMRTPFKRADGREMHVMCAFIDSGGHFTQEVYKAAQVFQRKGLKLYPIKGMSGESRQYVEMSRSHNAGIMFNIAVDSGKAAILYNAAIKDAGPGYMHFPGNEGRGYDTDYFKSLISERIGPYKHNGRQKVGWHKVYERNEALDCRNYARAVFKGFDWQLSERKKLFEPETPPAQRDIRTPPKKPRKRGTRCVSRGLGPI